MIRAAAYAAAVVAIAALTAWAVTALPFSDPRLGQPAAIITGAAAALIPLVWEPRRKDGRP